MWAKLIDFNTFVIITTICVLSLVILALCGPIVLIYDSLEKHAGIIGVIVTISIFLVTQYYDIYKKKLGENQAIEDIQEEIEVNLKIIKNE